MDETFKKFIVPVSILVLAFLSFLVIKPLLLPIVLGLCFAYLFTPVYKRLNSKIKSKYWSASLIILLNLVILILPLLITMPIFTRQVFETYLSIKDFDVYTIIKGVFPSLLSDPQFSAEIIATSSTLKASISNFLINFFKETLMNIPNIIFGLLIFFFTFFFGLLEADNFRKYFSIIFPFSKDYEERFFDKFEKVTNSVLYGNFIIGLVQGIIAGVGYFMLGVPNALLLTVLTTIVGVIPVIGPWLVWVPVDIYLFATGMKEPAIGLLIFSLFVTNWIDTIMRPFIVSSRAEMNSAIALIGMIGGTIAFGLVGFILGPLILAYLILLIEIYQNKKEESIILKENTDIP
jgi:predicted PurR-regulated permease PerM